MSFISALKAKFDESDLSLTVTVVITGHFDYKLYNFSELAESVEFINFVFDYKRTAGNYRIYNATKSLEISTDQKRIEKLITSGVSAEKIVLGIHLTGPAFLMTSSQRDEDAKFYQIFGYGPICKAYNIQPENWNKTQSESGVSVLRKIGGLTRMTLAFESSRSIANKVRYAVKSGLGGIAPIYIPMDDVNGDCGYDNDTFNDFRTNDGQALNIPVQIDPTFSLLRTINVAIDVTLHELTSNEN